LALFFIALCAGPASPQHRRPNLPSEADTNDWEAYYDFGVRHLKTMPARAADAFFWAARLAPWAGDPLYAQWVAFHMRDINRFEKYLKDDEKVLLDPMVERADSLARVAYLRNPFIHRSLEMLLYDALPGSWREDMVTRGWIAYANSQLPKANELFGRAIDRNPEKNAGLRHVRAALFVAVNRYDSALVQLTALVERARQRETTELHGYESKTFYEYAIARLHLAAGDRAAAREALERALVEELSNAPAHAALAGVLAENGDLNGALAAYAQAIELMPDDPIIRYQYGVALIKAQRIAEGLDQINRTIALEPWYADPYAFKGNAHEHLAQPDSARLAYRMYLARATRNAANRQLATRRLAALDDPVAKP
jgi:Tfp pilus assembly protein PilF